MHINPIHMRRNDFEPAKNGCLFYIFSRLHFACLFFTLFIHNLWPVRDMQRNLSWIHFRFLWKMCCLHTRKNEKKNNPRMNLIWWNSAWDGNSMFKTLVNNNKKFLFFLCRDLSIFEMALREIAILNQPHALVSALNFIPPLVCRCDHHHQIENLRWKIDNIIIIAKYYV